MNHPANHASRVPWSISTIDPLVIAEIGVNHDGDLARCLELVHAAASSGADAVKFQWFDPDQLLSTSSSAVAYQRDAGESDPRAMLRRLSLSIDQLTEAAVLADSLGLLAGVTVFTPALVVPEDRLPGPREPPPPRRPPGDGSSPDPQHRWPRDAGGPSCGLMGRTP